MTTAVLTELAEVIQLIPGYDPVATAGECWFDDEAAQKALDFFPECLVHVKGQWAGQPFELAPWQQAVIANVFGWKRLDECLACQGSGKTARGHKVCPRCEGSGEIEVRRYREVFVFVPRKNGKTTLAAGIALYMLFCDGEPGVEIYSAAADREQASLVFKHGSGMVRACDWMSEDCTIYGGGPAGQAKTIALNDGIGSWKVLSGEAKTKDGLSPHLAVIDETHAHPNADLVDVLETGMGSRSQPLLLHTTTSDYERESICNQKHDYASKVRDGIIEDESFLPVIYEASVDDDWGALDVWYKANPNLGISKMLSYQQRECDKATERPAYENVFKRLQLNIRTEQITRWLSMEAWNACAADVDDPIAWRAQMLEELKGELCFGGLDLGGTSDLSALALLFPRDDMDILLEWFWVPAEGKWRKDAKHRALYEQWIREGFIRKTAGVTTDYTVIRAEIAGAQVYEGKGQQFEDVQAQGLTNQGLAKVYGIREIAIDRAFQGEQLCTELYNYDGVEMVPFGQGWLSMAAPSKRFEELVLSKQLRHGGNPVLKWMASNVSVATNPAGTLKPVKPEAHSPLKVDGIPAAIMALGRAMETPQEAPGPEVIVIG